MNQIGHFKVWGVYVLGGICPRGVSVWGVHVQGVSDRGVCVLGVSVRGVHVRGGFVLSPFRLVPKIHLPFARQQSWMYQMSIFSNYLSFK